MAEYDLETSWTAWVRKYEASTADKKGFNMENMKLYTMRTVKEYMSVVAGLPAPSKLNPTVDVMMFREGIEPLVEACENSGGAKIVFAPWRGWQCDRAWTEALLACAGEQLGPAVCGCCACIRTGDRFKVELWIRKNTSNVEIMGIATAWRRIISGVDISGPLTVFRHDKKSPSITI